MLRSLRPFLEPRVDRQLLHLRDWSGPEVGTETSAM